MRSRAIVLLLGLLFSQNSGRTPNGRTGIIAGLVVNERQEPVAHATVQVFPASATLSRDDAAPPTWRASGSATTGQDGRFRISGLAPDEYVVAAVSLASFPSGGPAPAAIYAATFYPSVIDDRRAARVSAFDVATSIRLELVRVRGARLSGSVVRPPGDETTEGMRVRLYHQFGDVGSESDVAIVDAKGMFEIPRVPPGWYRLSLAPRQPESPTDRPRFAEKLIEVKDHDVEGLDLVLSPGVSIAGRVAAEGGARVASAVGLRVTAVPAPEHYSVRNAISATVAPDWSFQMNGPSAALVEQFKSQTIFWRQMEIAKQIVERHDASVLPSLTRSLDQDDRHARGNAAFIFAGLGDPRGLQVITDIIADRSDRPEGQGAATVSSDGRYHVARQIAADRYYAAHLLGDLRDPRAIPILVPLLKDEDVRSIVPWSLGQIGDRRAIPPLIDALDDADPSMRVLAIYALETLHAKEGLPRLISLLDDHERAHFGSQVAVGDAARAAIANLK